MEYKKSYRKQILFSILIVVILLASLYYFLCLRPGLTIKEKVVSLVPQWRYDACLQNFNIENLDTRKQSIWSDNVLRQMMRNTVILNDLSDDNAGKCPKFKDKPVMDPVFSLEKCQDMEKQFQAMYAFAEGLKQKVSKEDFIKSCQEFYINLDGFKEEVPEDERGSRSKTFCQNIYDTFQTGEITITDPHVYDTPDFAGAPTCNCVDADGKQRVCKTAVCKSMEFIVAASKNDPSLCSKLDSTDMPPFCNLYFDKQAAQKYEDIFKERYCRVF